LDCRPMICDLVKELKSVKISFLEQELMWHGVERTDIISSLNNLQERGVIYRRKGGVIELTEPIIS